MPYYDYRCGSCGHAFERQMPVDRRDDVACPACGSAETRRTMPRVYAFVKGGTAGDGAAGCDGDDCACGDGGCSCGGACSCGRGARALAGASSA